MLPISAKVADGFEHCFEGWTDVGGPFPCAKYPKAHHLMY